MAAAEALPLAPCAFDRVLLAQNFHTYAPGLALSEFARRTGTVVVAEGVESPDELATLRDLGIGRAQGYLFGRPQPLAAILSGRGRPGA